MVFCPACKSEWREEVETCPICNRDLSIDTEIRDWVLIGYIQDSISADFAREALTSYSIPAVVVAKEGFFGRIGLTLNFFHGGNAANFEVSVPEQYIEEALDVLNMTVGQSFQPSREIGRE